ncbi:MAG: SPFH domain-containing protein [Planctomycetaceae bacterium]|jgi:membrane protease subunit (stomatin/prohibitin family)|nr:SPFH domain-containing protein [Planctomycetaceae bacterium]
MSVIDRVTFGGEHNALAWKFPSDQLSTATQVIVNQSQEAILFKGGQALDILSPGTHTLTTGNIPLLRNFINLPFGGQTPFTAEVWYVDKTVRRDLKWGTPAPIPIVDAEMQLPLHLRANGQWGLRITDTRSFITQVVGVQHNSDTVQIHRYFIGEIQQKLTNVLGEKLSQVSYLKIAQYLNELSVTVQKSITTEFIRFGIEIINFNIVSINVPDDEQKRLMDIRAAGLDEANRLRNLSAVDQNVLQRVGMLDIGKTAAANEGGGAAAGVMNTVMGAAMALGPGLQLGQQMTQTMQPQQSPTPVGDPVERLKKLKNLFENELISETEYNTRKQEILKEI